MAKVKSTAKAAPVPSTEMALLKIKAVSDLLLLAGESTANLMPDTLGALGDMLNGLANEGLAGLKGGEV